MTPNQPVPNASGLGATPAHTKSAYPVPVCGVRRLRLFRLADWQRRGTMAPLQSFTGILAILLATSCSAFVVPVPQQTVGGV